MQKFDEHVECDAAFPSTINDDRGVSVTAQGSRRIAQLRSLCRKDDAMHVRLYKELVQSGVYSTKALT
jgi:hypothetical protein